jgi:Ran-binding protein 1
MSEAAKPDPSAEQAAAPGATQVKEETEKVTTGVTDAPKASEKPATATEKIADAASSATTTVKDNVFSMFGGGPKKEKKEEVDDADEPSGATKKEADVSQDKRELRMRTANHIQGRQPGARG